MAVSVAMAVATSVAYSTYVPWFSQTGSVEPVPRPLGAAIVRSFAQHGHRRNDRLFRPFGA